MLETISVGLACSVAGATFVLGNVTSYLLMKYKSPDLDGDGNIEAEELKQIYDDAAQTYKAFQDAIDDIIEDEGIGAEETVAALKNISKIFK